MLEGLVPPAPPPPPPPVFASPDCPGFKRDGDVGKILPPSPPPCVAGPGLYFSKAVLKLPDGVNGGLLFQRKPGVKKSVSKRPSIHHPRAARTD